MQIPNHFEHDHKPWYRQFWPWFLIAIPALTIIACIVTIITAISSPNAMVVDDYAKIGLTIQQAQARDDEAARLALTADVQIDQQQQIVSAYFPKHRLQQQTLLLTLSHPTLESEDQKLTLIRTGDHYFSTNARINNLHHWYLQLEPPEQYWRLNGQLQANRNRVTLSAIQTKQP